MICSGQCKNKAYPADTLCFFNVEQTVLLPRAGYACNGLAAYPVFQVVDLGIPKLLLVFDLAFIGKIGDL